MGEVRVPWIREVGSRSWVLARVRGVGRVVRQLPVGWDPGGRCIGALPVVRGGVKTTSLPLLLPLAMVVLGLPPTLRVMVLPGGRVAVYMWMARVSRGKHHIQPVLRVAVGEELGGGWAVLPGVLGWVLFPGNLLVGGGLLPLPSPWGAAGAGQRGGGERALGHCWPGEVECCGGRLEVGTYINYIYFLNIGNKVYK